MTQLSLMDPRLERLRAVTREGSKARLLGEWLLDTMHGKATTGDLADWGRRHYCSSVFERLRLDLRGKARWRIDVQRLPGTGQDYSSRLYVLMEDE